MLLNVQTEYSFLHSALNISAYVSRAKDLGYDSLGIADQHSLHGVYEFVKSCQYHHIKPLIGMRVTCRGMIYEDRKFSYLVYAQNYQGYQDLIRLSKFLLVEEKSLSQVLTFISDQCQSLIWIGLGKKSEATYLWLHQQEKESGQVITSIQQVMNNNMYLGMSLIPKNPIEVQALMEMGDAYQLKMVIVSQVNMLNKEDQEMLQVLKAIEEKDELCIKDLQEEGLTHLHPFEDFKTIHNSEVSNLLWKNTKSLVNSIQIEFPVSQRYLPKFQTPNEENANEYLKKLAINRLYTLGLNQNEVYLKRLQHELSVISEMGFSDYFLIIADILTFCHENEIQTGPGRGSAPGSLVSYLLDITKVDPIDYDLLFERFLNPERRNMPDIDVDVPDKDRHRVLNYIKDKYGERYTSQVVTFGTFGAKQAIRDVLKVFGLQSSDISAWTQQIVSQQNMTLSIQDSWQKSRRFRDIVKNTSHGKKYLEIAQKIEGLVRHSSTHAGAVVISDFPIETMVPVIGKDHQLQITQFSMYDIEDLGLLKMDFLGLRNLSVLDDVLKGIAQIEETVIDLFKLPLDDQKVYRLFQKADTQGVFQFESDGIKRVLRKLKPENFEDIVAVNALFRPGPMQQIDLFIQRKNGEVPIEYIHDSLQPILKKTYGIIVYQEQVMQIVQRVAGFSLGQADILRRAMSKKDQELMHQQREKFIQGALEKGYPSDVAEKLFNYIEEFSKYGFNRAHAVVYSYLAYQLAYLKTHYSTIFYSVILNHSGPKHQSFQMTLAEAKRELGQLLAIDINQSLMDFKVENHRIRVGFSSISGMRMEFIKEIINQRELVGNYKNFMDFLRRIPHKFLREDYILPLIKVGAFDMIDLNRATLEKNLQTLIQSIEIAGNNLSLFEEIVPKVDKCPDLSEEEKRQYELDILGFTIKASPLEILQEKFQYSKVIIDFTEILNIPLKTVICVLGIVKKLRVIRTKTDALMAFMILSDGLEEINIVIFPNVYDKYHHYLKDNQILLIEGKMELSNKQEKQCVAKKIQEAHIHHIDKKQSIPKCYIQMEDFKINQSKIEWLKRYARENPGPSPIILVNHEKQSVILDESYNIAFNYRVQNELSDYFGASHVVFK